ncbi:MAG: hypothetical protein A2X18_06830 [Bacteroidetes bacterium GWF2_40_14]|nr:MAG: hypothetical protein A2X18_06830 [Bacteroidetes bacterium GWF2_40_14]
MIISLTGFMGVGKSTVSARLAKHLYCKCIDLDKYIETKEELSIEDIFRLKGEPYFRNREEFYLNEILTENREKVLVLSLGGGTLISLKNQKLIKEKTLCVYLKSTTDTMSKRLSVSRKSRPGIESMASDSFTKGVEMLFEMRKEGYEYCNSLVIDVDNRSVKDILALIISSI